MAHIHEAECAEGELAAWLGKTNRGPQADPSQAVADPSNEITSKQGLLIRSTVALQETPSLPGK